MMNLNENEPDEKKMGAKMMDYANDTPKKCGVQQIKRSDQPRVVLKWQASEAEVKHG